MADIIAQLEVLSRDSGCLLDLSALIDLGRCKSIDIKTDRPHKIEQKDDYVCVTPTGPKPKPQPLPGTHYTKRCNKPGGCYEVTDAVCKKPTVVLDLELLVLLGLLTEEQLEEYMRTTGTLGPNDHINIEDDDVTVDPLLSVQLGDKGDILDLELLGKDGLLNLDLLKNHKKRGYGNYGYESGSGSTGPGVVGGNDGNDGGFDQLIDIDALGHTDKGKPALIDIDALNQDKRSYGDSTYYPGNNGGSNGGSNGGNGGFDQLIDIDALGHTDKGKPALIDIDALNQDKRSYSDQLLNLQVGGKDKGGKPAIIDIKALTDRVKRADQPLLDLDALGPAKDNNALIDIDLLTKLVGGDKKTGSPSGGAPISPSSGGVVPPAGGSRDSKDRPLLDLDALGPAKDNNALIDVDLLTKPVSGGKTSPITPGNPTTPVTPGTGKPYCHTCTKGKGLRKRDNYLTHYQPICGKGFKKEHRDAAEHCHATDVNHCLSLCQAKAALATIDAKVQVGDVANIMVCAAVEFNSNEAGDNCYWTVAPETEPCHDDQLEPVPDCTAFVRN